MIGWISLHRQIQNHWLWEEKPFSKAQAWIDMLLLANSSDKKILLGNELREVKTGSFVTSELKLMERWGWGKAKTRAFLDLLQSEGMILKQADRKQTTISIVKYEVYSVFENANRPQADRKQTTSRPRADTTNNNNNNNNNNILYSDVPELDDAIVAYVDYRKQIKKPMTENAVRLMMQKLNKMTASIPEQIEILNQSIMNGWQGIFPLKEKQQPKAQTTGSSKNEFNSFMEQLANLRES